MCFMQTTDPTSVREPASVRELVEIMRKLLGPNGCPWDREQTVESLRPYVLEEAYEVAHAIDQGKPDALCEELGDLLLQVVFQSELAERRGWFELSQVVQGICDKLIRRHPHVFADGDAKSSEEVLRSWDAIKRTERGGKDKDEGESASLPALLRAARETARRGARGEGPQDVRSARDQTGRQLDRLDQSVKDSFAVDTECAFGDFMLAACTLAHKLDVDVEGALARAVDRSSRTS